MKNQSKSSTKFSYSNIFLIYEIISMPCYSWHCWNKVFFIKFCFKFSEQVRPESFIYRSTSKLNLEIRFRFLSFWIEKSRISAPVAGSWQEARVCCLIDRTDAGVNTRESCDTGTQSAHLINGINIFPRNPTCSQFPSDSPVCWHHRTNNKLGTDSEKSHLHSISCH